MPMTRSSRRARSWRRVATRVVIVALAFVCIAVFVLYRLSRMPPGWYDPPADTQQTRDFADRVEYRLVEEAQKIRPPDEQWTVRIRDEQINAWLAARLPQWVAREQDAQWPEFLGTPQVRLTESGIDVAVDIRSIGSEGDVSSRRFVVVRIVPAVNEDGLTLRADRIGAGRLLLPGEPAAHISAVIDRLPSERVFGEQVVAFLKELTTDGHQLSSAIDLADDRHVQIVDLRLGEGLIDVTLQTRSGDAPQPSAALSE